MPGKEGPSHPSPPQASEGLGRKAQDVARRAGVSAMTVSRVFTDPGRVAEKTRRRVLVAARELGYQPNVAARMLRTGKVEVIGFLLLNHSALRGQFHSESLAAFESVLSSHGFSVLLSIAPLGKSYLDWACDLRRSGLCGGLVVQSDEISEQHLRALHNIEGPLVLMNYCPNTSAEEFGFSAVGFDNRGGVDQSVRHLAALGHRRIAFIGGTPSHHDAISRREGFCGAMRKLGLPVVDRWIRPGDFERAFESGAAQIEYLLAEGAEAPTAVICASDEIAIGALHSAHRCGVAVPHELSIVGFDNARPSAYTIPPLTTVEHSGWALGAEVARQIIAHLKAPHLGPVTKMLETRLIVRGSTAPPPADRKGGL